MEYLYSHSGKWMAIRKRKWLFRKYWNFTYQRWGTSVEFDRYHNEFVVKTEEFSIENDKFSIES